MNCINRFFRRYVLFTKRLLKKPAFLLILLLVPLLVGAVYIAASDGDSGIVTVALAMEDDSDPVACAVIQRLMTEDSLIRFVLCADAHEAEAMVADSRADGAWIFPRDMEEQSDTFVDHTHKNNAFIRVVQREENILLNISHEKLNAALYPYLSRSLYKSFLGRLDGMEGMTNEHAAQIYDSIKAEGEELFEYVYADGDGSAPTVPEQNGFILSPLRGMLAIMILFACMAAALFYMQDEQRGVFDRLPRASGFVLGVTYHLAAVVMTAAAVLAALMLTGMSGDLWHELPVMGVYALCAAGFCMCLRLLVNNIRLLCALSPLLTVVTAVMCPVFFAAPRLPALQYLLPTYHYLAACSDGRYLLPMLIYTAVLYAAAFLLHRLRAKQHR